MAKDKRKNHDFLVVGIGASAGGVGALRDFFDKVPGDSEMAFVVILHLSDQYESHLAEIIQPHSRMPVVQVNETLKVEPNKVYVIPPAKHLQMVDGVIKLKEPDRIRGKRFPIDIFFRTLADAYGKNGIAVILSGTGADGTLGLKRVKENGGIAIAQEPTEAEYDGMPRSAIATGMVDLVLPVEEIPARIISMRQAAREFPIPDEKDEETPLPEATTPAKILREILTILRIRTGHDFSNYKESTILRRIARRLQVHLLTEMSDYLKVLRGDPNEAEALRRDLLITVTNFFRDKEAFEALQTLVIPRLFADKTSDDQARVWSVGCATGEEAYSIAIQLHEYAANLNDPPKIQVFASDINEDAIATARNCLYDETIIADVAPERLRRFFTKEGTGYSVKKEIRDTVLFAPHNILRDPPFSKIDLITCRNLLIYLNRETQDKVFEIFHFALRPDGFLFLGSSESAEGSPTLFAPLDKKHRIYRRRPATTGHQVLLPAMPIAVKWDVKLPAPQINHPEQVHSFGEIHYKLIEQFAPPSVLVNDDYEIVHVSESAGRFLRLVGGEPTHNLLKIVRPALKPDLTAALFSAKHDNRPAEARNLRVNLDGEDRFVNLTVRPVVKGQEAAGLFLVIFDEAQKAAPEETASQIAVSGDKTMAAIVNKLEEELLNTKDRLRFTIEQHETSVEELKASNEELQAINEELRSATEELETSKEELESLNEELTTVNHEFQEKIDELSHANSDLQNFMQSTDIGTIFLDRALQIQRFTPSAAKIFNIIPSDIGRPLEHLTYRLDYENLIDDATEVLEKLTTVEREIRSADNRWYIARFLPYRTVDDRIEGVVLTFVNITERKKAEESLRFQAHLLDTVEQSVIATDLDGVVIYWNKFAEKLFGWTAEEANGRNILELTTPKMMADQADEIMSQLRAGKSWNGEFNVQRRDGTIFPAQIFNSPIIAADGKLIGVVGLSVDITERKRAEEALRTSEERLRLIMESVTDYAIIVTDVKGRIESWNEGAERIFGWTEEETVGQSGEIIFTPEDRSAGAPEIEMKTAREKGRAPDERFHLRKDGSRFYVSGVMSPLRDGDKLTGYVKVARDLTERKHFEELLEEADRRKDEFLATLAHELRNPLAPVRSGLEVIKRAECEEETLHSTLKIIDRQTAQIVHLVDDLLDISRISQGKIKIRKEIIEIKSAIELALETSRGFIEKHSHKLTMTLPDEPVYVNADLTRLAQVFVNILNNSAKYTKPGGQIWLAAERQDSEVVVRVQDNGIGIPPEMLSRIFEMFGQVVPVDEQPQSGLGIGLSLVKKLVDMHGGSISAQSEGDGKGSVFTVSLPVSEPPKDGKPAKPPGKEAAKPAKTRRVLVVDDNVDAVKMLELLLSMDGHEVQTAVDGKTALKIAEKFAPEVVLLDIGLPEMNGYEVARRLRRKMPSVLLVAISGWGQDEDRRRSKEAGFDYHLVKPVEFEELQELLSPKVKK